jgi:hypothetical protein
MRPKGTLVERVHIVPVLADVAKLLLRRVPIPETALLALSSKVHLADSSSRPFSAWLQCSLRGLLQPSLPERSPRLD